MFDLIVMKLQSYCVIWLLLVCLMSFFSAAEKLDFLGWLLLDYPTYFAVEKLLNIIYYSANFVYYLKLKNWTKAADLRSEWSIKHVFRTVVA